MRPLLLRIPNWLGDLVLAWPVLEAAAREPQGSIVVGPSAFEPLITSRFPNVRYLGWQRERRFALIGAIRREQPRAALLLTDSLSSALLMALAGVPERVGYAAEGRGILLTKRVPRETASRATPRTAEYRALARAAGLTMAATDPRFEATAAERDAARALTAPRVSAPSGRWLVVAPGAAYGPAKQWGGDRFGETAAALAREHSLATVVVGSAADRPAGAEVAAALDRAGLAVTDLTGATDLAALVGILDGAALVLTNDSGVMHVAAALRRPTVAIFGSTSPLWTSASAPWVVNLYASYPCSPCYQRTCAIGYGCLRAIGPDAALAAARRLLA